MDVRMPDGTVITNVPENITRAQLLAKYQGTQAPSVSPEELGGPPSVPTDEEVAQARAMPDQPQSRTFFDTVQDRFSQVRENWRTQQESGKAAMLHMVEPQAKYIKENPDVALATAGSILAPELAAPAAIAKYSGPLASAIRPLASAAIKYAPQIGGAVLGGGIGGGIKEATREPDKIGKLITGGEVRGAPTLESIMEESVKSAFEMGAAEVAGIGAGALLSKVVAPGAKSLSAQGKKLIEFAKQHKLPLKPSAAAPSLTAKGLEAGVESFFPGRVVKQFANKKIANVLATNTDDANRLIANVTEVYGKNSPGLEKTISSSSKAIKEGLEQWQPKVEIKYSKFTEAIGGRDRWTAYPTLRATMEKIKEAEAALSGGKDQVTVGFISNFIGKHSQQISADDLYKQYKRINHLKGADRKNLGLIRDAFKAEFDSLASETGEQATKLLGEANKEYILGKTYFRNDPTIRKIVSGQIDDSRVTVELFRDGKYGTLKQLEANIPKENFVNLQRLNLENLIRNSSVTPEGSFTSVLDGNKLLRWIDKNPKTFGLYPKDTQEAIKNLALYAKLHGHEAIAGTKGFGKLIEETAVRTTLGGGAAFAAAGTPGVVVTTAAAPALAWSMMRPNSVVNKWLVRGEVGPFAKGINEGLRVGGKLVFQDSLDND